MTYATYTELTNVTGSAESSTILQAVLDDAEREIVAYLKARGVTSSSCDATKSAELKIAQAGLLQLRIQKGEVIPVSGEMVASPDPNAASAVMSAYRQLRRDAFQILDDYIAVQSSLNTPRRKYVVRVN